MDYQNTWGDLNALGSETSVAVSDGPVQFPLKLMKISPISPYFHRVHLLIAADCAAYSYARFREAYGANRTLVIGCPDTYEESFMEKLLEILKLNDILSVTVVRTDAKCCLRLREAVMRAMMFSRKDIPLGVSIVFNEGEVVE